MIDIDHFKKVNDEFGHLAGDQVLHFVSKSLKNLCSDQDECIRLGGEEFIIILPKKDIQEAYILGERLRKTVKDSIPPIQKKITISLGVGEYKQGENINAIMHRVDLALYEAKSNGRNITIMAI